MTDMQIATLEVFGQLILAVILGSLIGLERKLAHKTAGMRTFALVSLGAALFTIISTYAYQLVGQGTAFDPSRIPSQIVVGIGFLAAGLIIFRSQHVEGLTTGAGLWVAGGIGLAVGFKLYIVAIFTAILVLVVFEIFNAMERNLVERIEKNHDHGKESEP